MKNHLVRPIQVAGRDFDPAAVTKDFFTRAPAQNSLRDNANRQPRLQAASATSRLRGTRTDKELKMLSCISGKTLAYHRAFATDRQATWRMLARCVLTLVVLPLFAAAQTAGAQESTDSPVLLAGGDFSYPPFEYLDDAGQVRGFNVDLLAAIARNQGIEVQHSLGIWNRQREALQKGDIDILPMFISRDRDTQVDFTQPFLIVNHEIFVRKGGPQPQGLDDLEGLEVIVENHAFAHDQALLRNLGATLILARSEADAMQLLASGRHDAAILGEIRGRRMLNTDRFPGITTSGPPVLPAGYAFAVGEGNADLLRQLDAGLDAVKASGEFNEIHARWLNPDARTAIWERLLRLTAWVTGGILLAALLTGLWLRALRRQVRLRTRELSDSEERFRKTFEHAAVGLAWLTPTCEWVDVNPALATMLGGTTAELKAISTRRVINRDDFRQFIQQSRELLTGKRDIFFMECSFRRLDGQLGWAEIGVSILREASGQVRGFIAVADDLTETQRLSAQLSFQQTHDPLTGLLNRSELERRLQGVLRRGRSTENVLLYLDLDQFKVINEACGHEAGDEMLGQVGHLLSSEVHEGDVLARLGGDEFAVLLENRSAEAGMQLAEQLRDSLAQAGFSWQGQRFNLSASIGLVAFRGNEELLGGVLGAADSACYAAKEEGGNRVHAFASRDSAGGSLHGDVRWVSRLNAALAEDRFELYAQSLSPLQRNEPGDHYEILLRLKDSRSGIVAPDEFLPAARRYYMMDGIDRWVVRNTLQTLSEHPGHVDELRLCSINLSGQSIGNPEFQRYLEACLDEFRVPPEKLCFEITESAAVADLNQAVGFARRLKERGCLFALDDFGIGMSSFAYLRSLPVDILKVDGMFVREMAVQPLDMVVVESVARAARVLGKLSVAEYVENEELLERVRELGFDYAQGYFIDRPTPLYERLSSHKWVRSG